MVQPDPRAESPRSTSKRYRRWLQEQKMATEATKEKQVSTRFFCRIFLSASTLNRATTTSRSSTVQWLQRVLTRAALSCQQAARLGGRAHGIINASHRSTVLGLPSHRSPRGFPARGHGRRRHHAAIRGGHRKRCHGKGRFHGRGGRHGRGRRHSGDCLSQTETGTRAADKEGEGRGLDDLHDVSSFEGKIVLSFFVLMKVQ